MTKEEQVIVGKQRYSHPKSHFVFMLSAMLGALTISPLTGCGTTTQRQAIEQLLVSDAVDRAVADVDFSPLAGRTVFLDTTYLVQIQSQPSFVNWAYVASSLRQQGAAAGCLWQEDKSKAEVIVEPRIGTLGTYGHDVTYGVTQAGALTTAAQAVPGGPLIPVLPDLTFGRSDASVGVAKLFVFAYEYDSRLPVWQSGLAKAESSSRNTWVLGVGPLQRGTIYNGTRIAGHKTRWGKPTDFETHTDISYFAQHNFPAATNPSEKSIPWLADEPKESEAR